MTLHLLKLCVGAESIEDLARWQKKRLAERKKRGGKAEVVHRTRHTPRRAAELLAGGSIYWVIKGQIAVRQRLLGFRPMVKNGEPHCALILDPKLVPVARRYHRPFQGWRYFELRDAPRDLARRERAALPEPLRAELTELGLL